MAEGEDVSTAFPADCEREVEKYKDELKKDKYRGGKRSKANVCRLCPERPYQ